MTTTITPELLYTDQQSIDRNNEAVNNALPLAQAIFNSYSAIPGIHALTADSWPNLFFDTQSFIDNLNAGFYEANFKTAYQALGINDADGLTMCASKLPDYSDLKAKIADYIGKYSMRCAPAEAFTIADSELIIDQAYVDRYTASAKIILSTETELNAKAAINQLIEALQNIDAVMPINAFKLHPGGLSRIATGFDNFDLNQLFDLIKVRSNPHSETPFAPVFELNLAFFSKLKQVVIEQQLP
jgi:hypothetical protein